MQRPSAVVRRCFSGRRSRRVRSCGLGAMDQKIDQQGNRPARASLLSTANPSGPGHIQVCPFQIFGELAEERPGGTGTALASTDIGDIREVALELIDVLLADRQAPGAVVGAQSG